MKKNMKAPAPTTEQEATPTTEQEAIPTTEQALEVVTVKDMGTFSFKSTKLAEYSRQIASLGSEIASKNIEIAKILGHVLTEKCYEEDGFKSVADYAEQVFGIKKQSAYQMANVGAKFYNTENETAKKAAAILPPSNLAEIVNMSEDEIKKEIEAGNISENSTQKELREVAKGYKEPKKVSVEPLYQGTIKFVVGSTVTVRPFERFTIDTILRNVARDYGFEVSDFKPHGKDKKVSVTESGDVFVVTYEKYVAPKVEKNPKKSNKFTVEELMAMLAEAQAEQESEN